MFEEEVMATTYGSVTVKCPFFTREKDKIIVCEGMRKNCETIHSFKRKEEKEKYLKTFCSEEYCKCRMYKLLEGKYAEGSK